MTIIRKLSIALAAATATAALAAPAASADVFHKRGFGKTAIVKVDKGFKGKHVRGFKSFGAHHGGKKVIVGGKGVKKVVDPFAGYHLKGYGFRHGKKVAFLADPYGNFKAVPADVYLKSVKRPVGKKKVAFAKGAFFGAKYK